MKSLLKPTIFPPPPRLPFFFRFVLFLLRDVQIWKDHELWGCCGVTESKFDIRASSLRLY